MQFLTTVRLTPATSEAQLVRILRDIERLLREDIKVWPDVLQVNLAGFSLQSLDIDIQCWFQTVSQPEFWALRQSALLGIMRIVREAGTSFAVPMQTINVARDERPPTARAGDESA